MTAAFVGGVLEAPLFDCYHLKMEDLGPIALLAYIHGKTTIDVRRFSIIIMVRENVVVYIQNV